MRFHSAHDMIHSSTMAESHGAWSYTVQWYIKVEQISVSICEKRLSKATPRFDS